MEGLLETNKAKPESHFSATMTLETSAFPKGILICTTELLVAPAS